MNYIAYVINYVFVNNIYTVTVTKMYCVLYKSLIFDNTKSLL